MVAIPHYENYSTSELYQALSTIREDLYPEILEILLKEIDCREFASSEELEECYLLLDKDRWPERALELCKQLQAVGSTIGKRFGCY